MAACDCESRGRSAARPGRRRRTRGSSRRGRSGAGSRCGRSGEGAEAPQIERCGCLDRVSGSCGSAAGSRRSCFRLTPQLQIVGLCESIPRLHWHHFEAEEVGLSLETDEKECW